MLKEEFGFACDLYTETKSFDLTKDFCELMVEERHNSLIPDVRIYSPKRDESIYIEIAVTHKVDENKEKKGTRIIEFLIDGEEDLSLVSAPIIPLLHEKINRYNFKDTVPIERKCGGNCSTSMNVFIVYNSGKAIINNFNLKQLYGLVVSNRILFYKILGSDDDFYGFRFLEFQRNVIQAFEDGIQVKNCFLCRYHAINENIYTSNDNPVFCKFLRKACKSNIAADCTAFRPDRKVYSQYLSQSEY